MAIDWSSYDPNKDKTGKMPVPTPRPTTPTPTPPPPAAAPAGPGPVGKFFQGVGSAVGQEVGNIKKNPKGETMNLLKIIGKGAISGGKDMLGALAFIGQKNLEMNPLTKVTAPGLVKEVQKQGLAKKIYANAAKQETQDTSKLNAGQKFIYGMAQFIPSMLLPLGGEEKGAEAVTKTIMQKMLKSGADNALMSAMLYNPEAHPGKKQLGEFINQTATNFVFGAAAHAAGKAISYVTIKPMEAAADIVVNKINDYLSEDVMKSLVPSMLGKFDENTVTVNGKEILDMVTGKKTTFDSTFFSSPDWKDVVKKYGVNPDNYPDRVTVNRPAPMPVIESVEVPKLSSADLHEVMGYHAKDAAASLAQGDVKGYSGNMAVMNEVAGAMEKKGYTIDRSGLVKAVSSYADYQRAYDDFSLSVTDQEFKKSMISDMDTKGLLKPIQAIKRLYNLVQGNPNYTDQKIADLYSVWASKNNLGGFDELGEALRNEGYDVGENDPTKLIEFAKSFPTVADSTKTITPPDPVQPPNVEAYVSVPKRNIEQPFMMTQAELDLQTKAKPNTGNLDVPKTMQGKFALGEEPTTPPSPTGAIGDTVKAVKGEFQDVMSPTSKNENTSVASGILRKLKATPAFEKVKEHLQNKKIENAFEGLTDAKQIEYASSYERTGNFGEEANAYLQSKGIDPAKYATYYKQSTDAAHQILQDVYGLDGYVNNYIRHAFTFNNKNDAAKFVQGFTKSLDTASTSVLKERSFATVQDAVDYMSENKIPFKVVESNPEVLRQWTMTNAKAAQAFSFAKNELKSNNLIRYLKPGGTLLPNEGFIDDKWANVMFKGDQGLTMGGRWVAPKEVSNLVNNAVSEGLFENSPTIALLKNVNNTLNQFQLGISAFHVATTTVNSAASEMGLGLQELLTTKGGFNLGMRASGVGRILKSATIIEPVIEDYLRGNAAIKAMESGDSEAVDYLRGRVTEAGSRVNIENRYRTQALQRFNDAIKNGKPLTAGINLLPAMVEKLASPIMENLVPRVKLGRFLTEGDSAVARATENYTKDIGVDATRRVLGDVWDKIDNIHGQMVQDNLFWNNSFKDTMNLFFRSFGWSYGTLRAIGSAGKESVGIVGRMKAGGEMLTPSIGIALAYPIISAEIGAVVNYMNTGKAPQSYKDYYFPQSGSTKPDGSAIRLSTPGYMKDMFSYWRNPIQTLLNKSSPEIQAVQEVLQNKDYYGVMLRNPDDPVGQQFVDMAKYVLTKFVPFSISSDVSIQQDSGQVNGKEALESLFGFQKASAVINKTDTENAISSGYSAQMGQKTFTPEEAAANTAKSQAKAAAKAGDTSKMRALMQKGVYTPKGLKAELTKIAKEKAKGTTSSQSIFKSLTSERQVALYNKMSDADKQAYYQYLDAKSKQSVQKP